MTDLVERLESEIIEVLAREADRADAHGGWSFLALQQMARCAQRLRNQLASQDRHQPPCADAGPNSPHSAPSLLAFVADRHGRNTDLMTPNEVIAAVSDYLQTERDDG